MEMWNQKITRENLEQYYNYSVGMVYSAVLSICKETTRTEIAIVKSYVELYQQRASINGEDVLEVFGDILLKKANEIIEQSPLPENMTFPDRVLDEYTRNSMYEKIINKIDSTQFKVAEFISTDTKKAKNVASQYTNKNVTSNFALSITPLLIFQLVILAIIIVFVSYASVTLPYRNDELVDDSKIYSEVPLQEQFVAILDYFPIVREFPNGNPETIFANDDASTVDPTASVLGEQTGGPVIPSLATTEPSATMG